VNFLAGSSTATITVDPFGDADMEPDETVILTVTAGAGYTVGSPSSATGTILNDDNSPPTVVVGYGQCGGGTSTGTLNLVVSDVETPAGSLTLTASSSNTAVVPLANISFGGSGANRTVTINAVPQLTLAFSDVTITVSDGTLTSSINIRVIVGTNGSETITLNSIPGGVTTVGSDMIFGRNGDDTINAGAGNDLVCGGNSGGIVNGGLGDDTLDGGTGNDTLLGGDGNDLLIGGNGSDTLTGGAGADSFIGGSGPDTATDFNAGQGDTQDGSVETAAAFGVEERYKGVFAYVVSEIPWWISTILGAI
jgi:RTX calcium-binding nonapeptide repeat (4 copies)